jgi:hypothetical protein
MSYEYGFRFEKLQSYGYVKVKMIWTDARYIKYGVNITVQFNKYDSFAAQSDLFNHGTCNIM